MRRIVLVGLCGLGLFLAACPSEPDPGEYGTFRFAGRARGKPPLNLIPPVTDRSGNIYVAYGGVTLPGETEIFVGKVGGGWTSGCSLTKGDKFGLHGWVGFDEQHQWYWSGDAFVSVSGESADCHRVLDRDPGTDVNLLFRGVLPWVRDAPTRTTTVAIVQSPIDPAPFTALVDLQAEILTNVRAFDPGNATQVAVVGVGADREANLGFALYQYAIDGNFTVEARFYDSEANDAGRAKIPTDPLPPYAVFGYLQSNKSGLVAGLLDGNKVLTFDKAGGRVRELDGMTAVGVHRWDGKLFVVGTNGDRPVIAAINDSGAIAAPEPWGASLDAAGELQGAQTIRDDRSLPSRTTTWSTVTTAIGEFPFLHAHSLVQHTEKSTMWLVAGPSFDTGGARVTAFAVAAVGVSYP
jgi:hypothetical protein